LALTETETETEARRPARATAKINLGYFSFPGSDDATANKTLAGKYDVAWFVPSKSQNADAALKFIDLFSQPENYAAYVNAAGVLPVQPNASLTADYAKEIIPLLPRIRARSPAAALGEQLRVPGSCQESRAAGSSGAPSRRSHRTAVGRSRGRAAGWLATGTGRSSRSQLLHR